MKIFAPLEPLSLYFLYHQDEFEYFINKRTLLKHLKAHNLDFKICISFSSFMAFCIFPLILSFPLSTAFTGLILPEEYKLRENFNIINIFIYKYFIFADERSKRNILVLDAHMCTCNMGKDKSTEVGSKG